MSARATHSDIKCPDCDSHDVTEATVISIPEWGREQSNYGVKNKYRCESCGLEFEAPSYKEQQEMKNGITLIIVLAIMIVMLLVVLL